MRLIREPLTLTIDLSPLIAKISSMVKECYPQMTDDEFEALMNSVEAEREDLAIEARRMMRLFLQTIVRRKLRYLLNSASIKAQQQARLQTSRRISQGDLGTEALAASMPTPPTAILTKCCSLYT